MFEVFRRDTVLWVAATVAVGLTAVAGSFNVQRMRTTEHAVRATHETQAELNGVLSGMTDCETGHRGYLLAGRAEFLEPFRRSEAVVQARLTTLDSKWSGQAVKSERLGRIRQLVVEKFDEMRRTINIRDTAGLATAALEMDAGEGKRIMDDLRAECAAADADEASELRAQATKATSQYQMAEGINLAGGLMAITILTITGVFLRKDASRREKAAAAIAAEKQSTDRVLAQLDALVRNAPYSIAFLDHDLRPVRVNETFAQANRLAVEDHFGRRLPDLLPNIPSDLLIRYQEVLAGSPPVVGRQVFGDGRVWEVSAFQVPLDDNHGGLGVIGQDVTEKHTAAERLRESEGRFRQLAEVMPQIVWVARADGSREYYNSRWTEFTGMSEEQTLGHGKWADVLHPDDRQRGLDAWARSVATGEQYEVEYRFRRHDGGYEWFLGRAVPVRDAGGQIVRWLGTCTGIDDRVHQEELLGRLVEERTLALQEQKIFLNAILDNVAEGVVACDAEGQLQLFNAATRRIHGLPVEPLLPEQWAKYYQLFEADGVTPMPTEHVPLVRAWRGEEVREAELVVRPTSQPERYLVCSGQQLRGDDGRVFGAVVSMRDMTERREYERELVRTADALRVSNEELEKFAYIASHDLQEPLRKIQAFGTRLADKYRAGVGEQGKDYIDRMLDSAGRMRRLISDLLSFSRVTTKAVAFEPVDLSAVARDVLNDLDELLTRSGGRADVGDLPTVPGDPSQLRQVFQNLIGNALKFAKPGVPPVVTVSAVPFDQLPADDAPPSRHGWRITIADNGIGFEPQYAERIFELFQRLHGRGEYEGTGLGLAIVRKIILRHGATISAHPRLGEGAVFRIDWPLLVEAPTNPSHGD